jgi:hypothetical protein
MSLLHWGIVHWMTFQTQPPCFPLNTRSLLPYILFDNSLLVMSFVQLPLPRQINCMRNVQSRIYLRYPHQDTFVFKMAVNGTGSSRIQIPNINPYSNVTVGVTVVNNAWLESDMVEDMYIGSKEIFITWFIASVNWQLSIQDWFTIIGTKNERYKHQVQECWSDCRLLSSWCLNSIQVWQLMLLYHHFVVPISQLSYSYGAIKKEP